MHKLHISTQFDSGAIDVVRLERADDIQLRIRKDSAAEFAQWFHFCLHGAAFQPVTLRFLNASACAYPKGWEGYQGGGQLRPPGGGRASTRSSMAKR